MASQLNHTAEQRAQVDRMIDEFRAARQRRLVKQGITLWDRTDQAYRNEAAKGEPPPEKVN